MLLMVDTLLGLLFCDYSEEWTVYIGSHSHWLLALSVRCGAVLWQTHLGDRIESTAALSRCRSHIIVGEWQVHTVVVAE